MSAPLLRSLLFHDNDLDDSLDTIFHDSKSFRNSILHSNVPDYGSCAFDFFFYVENDCNNHCNADSRNSKNRIQYSNCILFSLHHLFCHIIFRKEKWCGRISIPMFEFLTGLHNCMLHSIYRKKDLTLHKSGPFTIQNISLLFS